MPRTKAMKPVVTPRIAARSSLAMHILLAVALSSAPATVAALDQVSPVSRGWSAPLNGSLSSPSVVDGTVYVGTRDGILFVPTTPEHPAPDTVKPGSFLAIDVRDGSIKP